MIKPAWAHQISPELSKRIKQEAYRYVAGGKFETWAEDIAQEVHILFSLRGKGQTVRQAIMEAHASLLGQRDTARFIANSTVAEIPEVPVSRPDSEPVDWQKRLGSLNEMDRILIVLTYEWEFTLKEIGHLLGKSEATACLRLRKILHMMKASLPRGTGQQSAFEPAQKPWRPPGRPT